MIRHAGISVFCFFYLLAGVAGAQSIQGNLRRAVLPASLDSFCADSGLLVYNSVSVWHQGLPLKTGFRADYQRGCIYRDSSLRGLELEIRYRIIPRPAGSVFRRKFPELIEPAFSQGPRTFYDYRGEKTGRESVFGDGLQVLGNIARGIGFGNNQDVVLNSNLNLQLNGKLGKGIQIRAAISDENNPIQPQGNTQQIQDFDKVYVSILKDSNAITVGDFLMHSDRENYFLKYYKKSRGLRLDYQNRKNPMHQIRANGAISRGKFVRNELQGIEGVQGPYRLQGANQETNIIIISGTETIYLDGEKLERGQQNDYVIDYNTGELSFMPGRLITQFMRIVAEFQYSDRNYARSVFTFTQTFGKGKWSGAVNYFSEQDNKQQPSDTSNSGQVRTLLENSGDAPALFSREIAYTVFQTGRVNYRKTDSLGYQIYVFAAAPGSDTLYYSTAFSYVGKNKGNYVQIASSANGRVFAWVEPQSGIPAGDYEPYVLLVAPERMQMLTAQGAYRSGDVFDLSLEAAYSGNDRNTYSVLDKKNDDGLGLFFSVRNKNIRLGAWRLNSQVRVEYVSSHFRAVERYRPVEFARIWNRQLSNITETAQTSELISAARLNLNHGEKHKALFEFSNFRRGNVSDAYRGLADYSYTHQSLRISLFQELMSSRSSAGQAGSKNQSGSSRAELEYSGRYIRTGISLQNEQSRFSSDTSAGLLAASFRYEQLSAFVESKELKQWTGRLEASYRTDHVADGDGFAYRSGGSHVHASMEHVGARLRRLKFVGSYRQLNEAGVQNDDEVILSRVEYTASFLKNAVSSSTYYQVGTGREQKRQFSFALVQAGNGTHTWVDYNGNGIEEINEFEPAIYKDQARYVKIYLPGNEFIKSNTNEFNQSIRLQAPAGWQNGGAARRLLSRFNTISTYKADRRITDNRLQTILNPFQLNVSDTALIAVSSLIKQTTFFNRSNAYFGLEHHILSSRGKQFLNSGAEWRQNERQQVLARVTLSKRFNLLAEAESFRKENRNLFFENRNFNYQSKALRPELFYQTLKGIRVGAYFRYSESFNAPEFGNEQAYIRETGLELRYFIINKGNIDARISNYRIRFNGNANSPLGFDVLNGLSNGNNLTWNVGFGGKTKSNIQLNVSYEGRKTEVFRTIHIGRAEARYIF